MNLTNTAQRWIPQTNSPLDDPTFVQAFLSIAAKPNDPELAWYFKLEEIIKGFEDKQTPEYLEQLQNCPGMSEMIEQRYVGEEYKLEDLKRDCAPGTLGAVYYQHMSDNGIVPYEYGAYQSQDDLSYVKLRKMQTHDIWHVVAGYNTNLLGELALQGFYQGQGPTAYQTLLMNALILHFATIDLKNLDLALEALFEGWQRGRNASPLWAIRWEEMWHRPLAEIQAELNLSKPEVIANADY